jgi:hypothetical protein
MSDQEWDIVAAMRRAQKACQIIWVGLCPIKLQAAKALEKQVDDILNFRKDTDGGRLPSEGPEKNNP